MPHDDYRAIDFRPALAVGRRVYYMDDDGRVTSLPVVGWLVMERAPISPDGEDAYSDVPVENRDRIIVAGVHTKGYGDHVVPADWHAESWLHRRRRFTPALITSHGHLCTPSAHADLVTQSI